MLVLTRKVGETLMIGDSIRVTILDIQESQVRIGIAAPTSVPINREEVHKRLTQQKDN
jgi:carbon storage regulator